MVAFITKPVLIIIEEQFVKNAFHFWLTYGLGNCRRKSGFGTREIIDSILAMSLVNSGTLILISPSLSFLIKIVIFVIHKKGNETI